MKKNNNIFGDIAFCFFEGMLAGSLVGILLAVIIRLGHLIIN
jgi:hypothetical protein